MNVNCDVLFLLNQYLYWHKNTASLYINITCTLKVISFRCFTVNCEESHFFWFQNLNKYLWTQIGHRCLSFVLSLCFVLKVVASSRSCGHSLLSAVGSSPLMLHACAVFSFYFFSFFFLSLKPTWVIFMFLIFFKKNYTKWNFNLMVFIMWITELFVCTVIPLKWFVCL